MQLWRLARPGSSRRMAFSGFRWPHAAVLREAFDHGLVYMGVREADLSMPHERRGKCKDEVLLVRARSSRDVKATRTQEPPEGKIAGVAPCVENRCRNDAGGAVTSSVW